MKISQVLVFYFTTPFSGDARGVFRTWSDIYNVVFLGKILNKFKLLTIFAKRVSSQMLEWVENRLLANGLKY